MSEVSRKRNNATVIGSIVFIACVVAACSNDSKKLEGPKPTVNISANPNDLVRGDTTVIKWSTTDATNCVASGEWRGNRPTSGTENIVTRYSNKLLYTLTCNGPGGTAMNTAVVASHAGVSP